MSAHSKISWTDATWNPIRGCSRVSEGCRHCYAEVLAARYSKPGLWGHGIATTDASGEPRWTGEVRLIEHKLDEPMHWKPRRIFVNSLSDLFHESLPVAAIASVFDIMAACELRGISHTFQILTKRAERMRLVMAEELPQHVGECWPGDSAIAIALEAHRWPLPNVWLGVSAENQAAADARVPALRATPAAVRFVSAEPLLGPIIFKPGDGLPPVGGGPCCSLATPWRAPDDPLDWIIIGGESGPGYRTMDPGWARLIADTCAATGVACFVKQDSGPRPGMQGRLGDDLWAIKEFPRPHPAGRSETGNDSPLSRET